MIAKKHHNFFAAFALLAASVGGANIARAQYRPDLPMDSTPANVAVPVITDKPNANVALDLNFKNSDGESVNLASVFDHKKPVILSLVYFSCPKLCGFNQDGLVGAVKAGPRNLQLGKDYNVVVVSIDPDDTPAIAKEKRANYLHMIGLSDSQPGFVYLTGSESNIKTLADTIGFGYAKNFKPDADSGKYAHSTGYFICTPDGHLAQTIGGINLGTDQLYNSLINASQGKLSGGFFYTIGFACGAMRINPITGQAEANPWFFAGTAGGVVSIIFMVTFLSLLFRSDTKRKAIDGPTQLTPDPTPSTKDSE